MHRLLKSWVTEAGFDPNKYGTESLRRTKALHILNSTGDLETVRVLLGHEKIESTATLAVTTPMILTVHPTLRVQSVKDLIALIKANPGKFSFASGGTGSPGHLVGEQLRLSVSLDLVHVPFNSAGLAIGCHEAAES